MIRSGSKSTILFSINFLSVEEFAADIPALITSTFIPSSISSNFFWRNAGHVSSSCTSTPKVDDPPMAKILKVLSGFSLEISGPLKPKLFNIDSLSHWLHTVALSLK